MLQSKASKNYDQLAVHEDLEENLVPSTPTNDDVYSKERQCCKDPFFALLFLAGVASMLTSLILHRDGLETEWNAETAHLKKGFAALSAAKALGASFGVAFVFSAVWLLFMRYCVKLAVYGLFTFTLAAEIAGCSALWYVSGTMDASWGRTWLYGLGVLLMLLICYTVYVIYGLCNRVALAASMIKVSGGVLKQCSSVFLLHALLAVCKFLWVVFCGSSAWVSLAASDAHAFWVACGYALMTYWGLQILTNIALVTSYGAFGEWYYEGAPSTCGPFCRASTSHFGSIAFGSLLVAVVETTHDVLHALSEKGYIPSWVMCCIDKALDAVKAAMEYVNMYGFVQVAVHDDGFFTASKRALSFLKYKGLTALINDTIVSRMASFGALGGGVLSGTIPVLLSRYHHHADLTSLRLDSNQEATLATAGFALGFFVVYTLIAPIHAMATALLVCFAEHPEVLARDHEEEYKALVEPWESVYGTEFVDKAATLANLTLEDNGLMRGTATKPLHPLAQELEQLVELRATGALTEDEFAAAKAKLLSN